MKICPVCFKLLEENRHPKAIYCGKKCKRQAGWAQEKERYVSKRKTECVSCGNVIPSDKGVTSKYCSEDCRMSSSNERRNERRIAQRVEKGIKEKLPPTEFDRKYANKASNLKKRSWTVEEWVIFNYCQNGKCAICQKSNYEQGMNRELAADHDHETGERRALICFKCNILLGHANDDVDTLRAAANYLESH